MQAHAWAEIYLDGEGWIPVETTPAAGAQQAGNGLENGEYMPNAETAAEAAGTEYETSRENGAEQNDQAAPDEEEGRTEPGKEETADGTDNGQEDENSAQKEQKDSGLDQNRRNKLLGSIRSFFVRMAPIFAAAAGIVFIWGMICLRRYAILRRQEKYGAGQIMVRMLEVLGMAGKMKDCDAMGADFSEKLSHAVPSISRAEAVQIQRAALQESFGNEELSKMQGRETRRVYKKACSYVYKNLPWYKKIYFRYGKVYG